MPVPSLCATYLLALTAVDRRRWVARLLDLHRMRGLAPIWPGP